MRRCPRSVALVVVAVAFGAGAPLVADEPPVGAGAILGHVRTTPPPHPAPPSPIERQQDVCGTLAPDESVVVGRDGSLAGVVAWLEGLPRPAGLRPATVRLDQQRCRFVPHVLDATSGATIELTSQDAVLHTVHAVLGSRRTLFNVAIPIAGMVIRKRLLAAGRIRFRCDVGHTWMSAFLSVFDHPYHAVSDADGSFRIDGAPPGEHVLHLRHERLGERTARVRVPAGGAARIDLAL